MAENKTKPTRASISDFLATIDDPKKQADATDLIDMMQKLSGHKPAMWGPSIIGFGTHHYVYESGREGDMPIVGFSPRKAALVLYCLSGGEQAEEILSRLGKFTRGKGCLYIKKLADIDRSALQDLIKAAVSHRAA
jgi:hypothetical protein